MITLIEIAIYAVVLSGGAPQTCKGYDHSYVTCTSSFAKVLPEDVIQFSDGTLVDRDNKGFPRFSNGITSWFESSGWLAFSNGVEVRRVNPDLYKIGNKFECRTEMPDLVECVSTPPQK